MTYPQVQISSIEEELDFVFNVVKDQALLDAVEPIRDMMRVAVHRPKDWGLVVKTS